MATQTIEAPNIGADYNISLSQMAGIIQEFAKAKMSFNSSDFCRSSTPSNKYCCSLKSSAGPSG